MNVKEFLKCFENYLRNKHGETGTAASYRLAIEKIIEYLSIKDSELDDIDNISNKLKNIQKDFKRNKSSNDLHPSLVAMLGPSYTEKGWIHAGISAFLKYLKKNQMQIDEDNTCISSEIKVKDFSYRGKHMQKASMKAGLRIHDYLKEHETKIKIGKFGESKIIEYERDRLKEIGLHDYIDKIKSVADDLSKGYDILSFDIINEQIVEVYIEVKTSKNNIGRLTFYITSNELEKFKNSERHKIYYLYKGSSGYNLHIVDKSKITEEVLSPKIYLVDIDGDFS